MTEIVYDTIRERILKGEYAPNERLITADLAEELGVSRMPIREALQRLEAGTGLVTMIPHKGAVVNEISDDDLYEIFHIRSVLEGLVSRLACPNLTDEELTKMEKINQKILGLGQTDDEDLFQELNLQFHSIIWNASKSPRLVGMLQNLYDASRSYRYISIKMPGRLEEIDQEHREIIKYFKENDADAVEKCMIAHYQHTLHWLMSRAQKSVLSE